MPRVGSPLPARRQAEDRQVHYAPAVSARENRVNLSTTRPADFVVDGWRRGVHYSQGEYYVVSMDVAGELPRLLVGRRLELLDREAPGVRQPFGVPALDGPLIASSTGLDFPKALVRLAEPRDAWLGAAAVLRFVEVSAPAYGQTGLVVATRLEQPEHGLDLAAGLVRSVDDILARKTLFADAAMAQAGPATAAEPSAEVLTGLVAQLAEMTNWVAGHAARVGDAVEARLVLTEAGVDVAGVLRVAWRDAAATIVDATLDAAVPGVPWAPLHLTPQTTLLDRLRAIAETRVGHAALDEAFVSVGDPRQATSLSACVDVMLRLAGQRARIELSEERVRILVPPAARTADALRALCADLLEIWRRLVIARMGHPLVETPER